MAGSVWQPALDAGFEYTDFAWSGANLHKDRQTGGRRLSDSLGRLAEAVNASPGSPLPVNLVAHSHGGNVALESLRDLPDSVEIRSCTMLGTPLIWRVPASRVFALASAGFLVWLLGVVVWGFFGPSEIHRGLYTDEALLLYPWWGRTIVLLVVLFVYPWVARWWLLCSQQVLRFLKGVWRRGGWRGSPAYGPTPNRLAAAMAGRVRSLQAGRTRRS